MRVRFHLSYDSALKCWYLEAHDIPEGRWFLVAPAAWAVQLKKLCNLGMSSSDLGRLSALEAGSAVSAWTEEVEIEAGALGEASFVLQPTIASAPRQSTRPPVGRSDR